MADLAALARAYADRGEGAAALEAALRAASTSTNQAGSGSKAQRDAALLALKAAQQRLVPPGDAAAAAVGRAALAAAAGSGAATPPPPTQLASWRYNLARRLVSCKAFADAHAEATLLFEQLRPQEGAGSKRGKSAGAAAGDAKATAEAANLGVGTALVLLLCCIEGRLLDDAEALDGMLAAAGDLPHWLSQLRPEEAGKHREAAHKYLYSAAVGLVERRSWARAADVCGAMLAAAGDDAAAQARALAAAGKLAGHMPEEHAAATAAAAARACTCGDGSTLGATAALELLGQLCSAAQRATSPTACEELQQAVQACASAAGQPLLRVAALLLPALALQTGGPSPAMAQAVRAATALVADAIQQLEAQQQKPAALAEQLALLEAAVLPANALRRILAARMPSSSDKAAGSGELVRALGGAPAADTAASVLELLAGAVGMASRCADSSGGAAAALAGQGHAAAVGLATATRLRAACAAQHAGGDASGGLCSSSQAVRWLLGWDLQSYAASSELPPQGCAVEAQELAWLASALFNAGVDLHGEQRYAAAAAAMQAALAVAAVGISDAAEEAAAPRLADVCRKCVALSDAQQQAGDAAAALGNLGHTLALLLQLGAMQPASWRPLVQAFVRLQADLPATAKQQPVAAAAAAKRGRGAAAKKAAAPASSSGSQAVGDLLLTSLLQQHAAQLPEGSLAVVTEQELQCLAAQPGSAGGGSAALSRKVQRLLHEVFPPEQHPVEHASVLLTLHQAGLQADAGLGSTAPLERAVAVLGKARGSEAASMVARARCMLAVDSARQLARQALLEQQQERQRSHAAASTSAAGSQEQDAAAVGQLVSGSDDAAGWRRVQEQAAAAVDAVEAAGGAASAGGLQAAFEELAWMLGLHGSEEAAARLRLLLPQSSTAAPASVLGGCLFPGAPGTAAELQQAAEAAAEGGRSPATALQRATLHQAAAEACAAAGDLVPALFHASEAHRLLAALVHGEEGSGSSSSSSGGVSWWRLSAAYLGGLLQLGQLFEAAGLADEAVHALREGQHLATAAGARPLATLCSARLADVLCKQGQAAAAGQAVAAAEQQLAALPSGSSLPLQYCSAAVQLARAQLGGKASVSACQEAATSCQALAAAAAKAGSEQQQWCDALHAAALLTAAEAALQHGDQAAALEHATAALGAASGGSCSAARQQQAAASLFLGLHAAPQPSGDPHLAIWGLGQSGSGATPADDSPAVAGKGRGRKPLAPKQRAARGRSKAAAAQDEPCSSGAADQPPHVQHLWRALKLGRGQLAVHRLAAAALAETCGTQGRLHLAAWLLHSSLGSAMRLQYQLVVFSRRQQLVQRQRRAGAAGGPVDATAQLQQLEGLAAGLELGLDWRLVAALAGSAVAAPTPAAPARERKAATKPAAAAAGADPAAALAALEQQAQQQLQAWQAAMPAGTAACSIAVLPSGGGGSLLISRLSPADEAPPLLVSLPVAQLSASLSQHPIRALQMDDDAAADVAVSSVQSVLDEMQGVLADSGRSMRELRTDTKQEQREWWRARLALEDRLAALVRHLDSSWLGPWRCLLLGDPAGSSTGGPAGVAAAQYLEQLLEAAGSCVSPQQAGVLRHVAATLAQHVGGGGSMTPGELRQAAHQLVHAAGLACTQEQQHELEALLASAAPGEGAAAAAAAPPTAARVRKGRSVKFADEEEDEEEEQQEQQQQEQPEPTPAPAASRGSRARKPAASAGHGRRAAAAAADEEVETGAASCDASPVAALSSLEGGGADEPPATVARDGLCQVFDELSLAEPATGAAAAAAAGGTTTARSGKHRSRLRMMQAGTPGPATARRAAAATAPRPARQLPLTAAKTAPPPAARAGSGSGSDAATAEATGPVLLVLDGALQALPWESASGMLRQRCYRMPSLACAAASAARASTSIELSSTFYALNPSGDLAATQSAFQDWFARMRGWEGTAGRAPSAAELAGALTSRQLFLYCGHGGGEQYIPAAKLRSLERCSAALLMGCSSGCLRVQRHYEPSGAVLAYLLAGCPAAVANLWDVTDKDIDRFSQAVLTAWISGAGASGGSSGGGGSSGSGGADMCAALAPSRGTCKLPHLVGAAPVCYGIPARLFASEA